MAAARPIRSPQYVGMARISRSKLYSRFVFVIVAFGLFLLSGFGRYVESSDEYPGIQKCHNSSGNFRFFPPAGLDVFGNDIEASTAAHHFIAEFIPKYAMELRSLIEDGEIHVRKARDKGLKMTPPVICKGQIGTVEASFLYMLIRESNPSNVLEVGALCGWSSWVMLRALKNNGCSGRLTTFDMHDYAPTFVGNRGDWTFHAQDIFAFQESNANLVKKFDMMFIDAVHHNSFAVLYTDKLFRSMKYDTPVFVHDIFSPFQIVDFKPCQKNLTLDTLDDEMDCMRRVANDYLRNHKRDLVYSSGQPAGEGQELMSWLSRTGRSASMFSLSPYAAPTFASLIFEAFEEYEICDLKSNKKRQINNPAIFFVLKGRTDDTAVA